MKLDKAKYPVGTKVYLKPVGNRARDSEEIRECEINKIGNKYFEVGTLKFYIENCQQVTDYMANWELYFFIQDIADEEECKKLGKDIRKVFDSYGKVSLSLDTLRKISKLIIDDKNCPVD